MFFLAFTVFGSYVTLNFLIVIILGKFALSEEAKKKKREERQRLLMSTTSSKALVDSRHLTHTSPSHRQLLAAVPVCAVCAVFLAAQC